METINLTAEEKVAIEFYQETAEQVLAYGMSYFDREERQQIRKGKQALAKVEAGIRASLNPRSKAATEWFPEEYDALAAAYHYNPTDKKVAMDQFRAYSARHTDSAVSLALSSCRFLDTKVKDSKGLHDYANGLLLALQDIDSDRYQGNR